MGYKAFTKEEFESNTRLKEPIIKGHEYVYRIPICSHRTIMVYSSIGVNGLSRQAGGDAIRVFVYDEQKGRPLSKSKRIYRTDGAFERLKGYISTLQQQYAADTDSCSPSVIEIKVDENRWEKTADFKGAQFKYERFNPVQSAFMDVHDHDANTVIAAETSAGKTVLAEMGFLSVHALSEGKKCIYLCPLKALAQEKLNEWTSPGHFFAEKKIAIATGDYLTPESRDKVLRECEEADIVVMTSELLDSLTRRIHKVWQWFKQVGSLVVDEGHLLTMPARGSALECALLRFTAATESRILFLSATMPNTREIAEWLCKLNNKTTYFISSKWRPCSLDVHYVTYDDFGDYSFKTIQIIYKSLEIINDYPSSKFIVFVHSKAIGRRLLNHLKDAGISSEFHNADLERDERIALERRFKSGDLNVLIATSTLAYGLNLPARRVIIAGVHRGIEEVSVLDIKQMVGRSGRVGIDPRGDAYILIPSSKRDLYEGMLDCLPDIQSRLVNEELAFHIVNEINEGYNTLDKLWKWYSRSFAAKRGYNIETLGETIDDLLQWGVIKNDMGKYYTTPIGKIASWYYYSPYTVAILKNGMQFLSEADDVTLAWVIGNAFPGYPTPGDVKHEVEAFTQKANNRILYNRELNCYAIYLILTGKGKAHPELSSVVRGFQADSGRIISAMKSIGNFYNMSYDYDTLLLRLKYGVPAEIAPLCQLPGIGAVRASKLFHAGFRKPDDVIRHQDKAIKLLGKKVVEKFSTLTAVG